MNLLSEPLAFEFFRQGLIASRPRGRAVRHARRLHRPAPDELHRPRPVALRCSAAPWSATCSRVNFYLGGGAVGLPRRRCSINAAARRRRIGADAAIGIVTTASFAFGVALISKTRSFTRNFEAALFGNILGVTPLDLLVVGVVTVGVARLHRPVLQAAAVHDLRPRGRPDLRRRVGLVDTLFALAMAATIVASINVVGVTLIAATLVIPATTARLLTDSFGRMIVISTVWAPCPGSLGMYVSYWLDVSSGRDDRAARGRSVPCRLVGTSALRRRPKWTSDPIPANAVVRPGDDFG